MEHKIYILFWTK